MSQELVNPKLKVNQDLYVQDYYLWIYETIKILRQKQLEKLDISNLIEEMEDMGRSEKRAITSNLRILLMHLLKYQYQAEKRTNSWLFTIREHRKRLKESLQTSPSLKNYFREVLPECYQDARELAADETGLSIDTFPESVIFSPEDTLNPDYLPKI